jgi:hypothetical protein
MRKLSIYPLVAGVLIGCLAASSLWAESYEDNYQNGARQFDGAVGYGGLRGPAIPSSQVSYRGETRTQTLTRTAGQDDLSQTIEVPVNRVWTELALVTETYEDYDCREVSGEGRGDWHGFFSAPRTQKAERLADAIKGVGPGTAQCIVDSGAFATKPRSWRTFKSRVRQAEEACGKGIYYRVVIQYGKENAENLGYYSEQDCRPVMVQEQVLKPVERSEFDHMARLDVSLRVENAPLLASESERFGVSYDGFNSAVQPDSRFNRYQVEERGKGRYLLEGQRQMATPNNSLLVEVIAGQTGPTLRITDTDYNPALDPQVQTFALITIKKQRFLLDKKLLETKIPLAHGMRSFPIGPVLGAVVPAGETYYIEYSVLRTNSRMNNASPSSAKRPQPITR